MMKRLYIIMLINCLFTVCLYADYFEEIIESGSFKIQTKSPQGIYFENKEKRSGHIQSGGSNLDISGAGNYNYNAANSKIKTDRSFNISSGRSERIASSSKYNMKSYLESSISSNGVNLTLLNEKSNIPIILSDILIADNPTMEGPGGSSSGSVEGHVGAPVGDGIFILLILASLFFYTKRKSLLNKIV